MVGGPPSRTPSRTPSLLLCPRTLRLVRAPVHPLTPVALYTPPFSTSQPLTRSRVLLPQQTHAACYEYAQSMLEVLVCNVCGAKGQWGEARRSGPDTVGRSGRERGSRVNTRPRPRARAHAGEHACSDSQPSPSQRRRCPGCLPVHVNGRYAKLFSSNPRQTQFTTAATPTNYIDRNLRRSSCMPLLRLLRRPSHPIPTFFLTPCPIAHRPTR